MSLAQNLQRLQRLKIYHDCRCDICGKIKSTLCEIPVDKSTILENVCGKCMRLLIRISIHEKRRKLFIDQYKHKHDSDSEDEFIKEYRWINCYFPRHIRNYFDFTIFQWDVPRHFDLDGLKLVHQRMKDSELKKRKSRRCQIGKRPKY